MHINLVVMVVEHLAESHVAAACSNFMPLLHILAKLFIILTCKGYGWRGWQLNIFYFLFFYSFSISEKSSQIHKVFHKFVAKFMLQFHLLNFD